MKVRRRRRRKEYFCSTIPKMSLTSSFGAFCNAVTCGCQVEEGSPTKNAGLFSARLVCTGS